MTDEDIKKYVESIISDLHPSSVFIFLGSVYCRFCGYQQSAYLNPNNRKFLEISDGHLGSCLYKTYKDIKAKEAEADAKL